MRTFLQTYGLNNYWRAKQIDADEHQMKCVNESSDIVKSIISTLQHQHNKCLTSPLSYICIHGPILKQWARRAEYARIMCDKRGLRFWKDGLSQSIKVTRK